MFIILIFTIIGFLLGLAYVMKKRQIRPGRILAVTFLGMLFAGILKALKNYYKINKRKYF